MASSKTLTGTYFSETDSYRSDEKTYTGSYMDVGKFSDRINENFVWFVADSIPDYAIITKCQFKAYQHNGGLWETDVYHRASLCTSYRDYNVVDWANKPAASGAFYAELKITSDTTVWRTWTIPSSVSSNANDCRIYGNTDFPHYYYIVKIHATSTSTENAKEYYTTETSDTADRPQLYLEYTVAPNINVMVGGVWKDIGGMWVYTGGAWHSVVGMWVYTSGAWHKC